MDTLIDWHILILVAGRILVQKIFDGELKGAACTCSLDICNAHSLLGRLLGNISVGADSDGYTSVICVPMKFVQLSLSL